MQFSWLECLVWDQMVARSSRAISTNSIVIERFTSWNGIHIGSKHRRLIGHEGSSPSVKTSFNFSLSFLGSHVPMAGVSPLQGESGGFDSLRVHKFGFNQQAEGVIRKHTMGSNPIKSTKWGSMQIGKVGCIVILSYEQSRLTVSSQIIL